VKHTLNDNDAQLDTVEDEVTRLFDNSSRSSRALPTQAQMPRPGTTTKLGADATPGPLRVYANIRYRGKN